MSNWGNEFLKVEDNSTTDNKNGVTLTVTGVNQNSGTWQLSGIDLGSNYVMAVLKGATTFTAYLLNSNLNGNWTNQDLRTPNGKGNPTLSHFSIYTAIKSKDINPNSSINNVPEPVTILGTLLAFALGGVFKHNRKNYR